MMRIISVLLATFVLVFTGSAAIAGTFGHWNDNEPTFPRGYAYIHDNTSASWPVYTAAISWDQAPKLDLVYRSGGTSCTGNRCIAFGAKAIGYKGCPAYDTFGVSGYNMNGVHISGAVAWVDSGCVGRTYNNRLEAVCHEMGHVIGLTDRGPSASSCMRAGVDLGNQTQGSSADFSNLNTEYSHDS